MTLDELCKRLAVCHGEDGYGCVGVHGGCRRCHGTGLDPAKVEMLRAFERDVIERCAGVCRAYEAERLARREWELSHSPDGASPVARGFRAQAFAAEECAAAIEGMAGKEKP